MESARDLRASAAPPRPSRGRSRSRRGTHLGEVGVPGVEDCRPEPGIEGDLRRGAAGECGTPRWGRPPEADICLTLGKRLFRADKSISPCSWSPLKNRAPPPPPSPAPSGSASHYPECLRKVGGLKPPQVSSQAWELVPAKSSSLVTQSLRQQPPGWGWGGEVASFPNWQVMTAPPRPGEPVTSASGGGNEVGGVEGLEPAWGVSGASKGGRSSRSHWGQVSEEEAPQLAQLPPGWAGPTRQTSGCCSELWEKQRSRTEGAVVGKGPGEQLRPFSWKLTARSMDRLANEP